MRSVAAATVVLLLSACGTSSPAPADDALETGPAAGAGAPVDADAAPAQLREVAQRTREQVSVRYSAVVEGSQEGEPSRVDARMEGELDLRADAGTADLDLVVLSDMVAMAEAEGAPRTEGLELAALSKTRLAWTAQTVTFLAQGQQETVPRDGEETAVLARVPAEPAGLLEVVATATQVRVEGTEDVDGVATTHLVGEVEPRASVEAGLGTSAQLRIAEMDTLPVEVWLDADGLPRRLRYTFTVPSMVTGVPRTTATTYEYRGWGEPVDLTD